MLNEEIVSVVEKDGFCVFDLDKATQNALSKINLNNLDDGFHINQEIHNGFVTNNHQIKSLVEFEKATVKSKKLTWNTINIARVVKKRSSEKYRTHFDSHLYTLVIPLSVSHDTTKLRGQLYQL